MFSFSHNLNELNRFYSIVVLAATLTRTVDITISGCLKAIDTTLSERFVRAGKEKLNQSSLQRISYAESVRSDGFNFFYPPYCTMYVHGTLVRTHGYDAVEWKRQSTAIPYLITINVAVREWFSIISQLARELSRAFAELNHFSYIWQLSSKPIVRWAYSNNSYFPLNAALCATLLYFLPQCAFDSVLYLCAFAYFRLAAESVLLWYFNIFNENAQTVKINTFQFGCVRAVRLPSS